MAVRELPIAHRDAATGATHGLVEHLTGTATLATRFAASWGGAEAARFAAIWHDLGKFAPEFQAMIRQADADAHLEEASGGTRGKVNHSSAGAQWAVKQFGRNYGRLLAYVIAGHHAGLPDWVGEGARRGLADRLRDEGHLERALRGAPDKDILNQPLPTVALPDGIDRALWVRMLASAVFDADFLDTEAFFDGARSSDRAGWASLPDLLARLDAKLDARFGQAQPTPVNRVRAEVLAACRAAAERGPGLFSLTVPTGGGKTLSSLAFALRHARCHDLARVIYAVPFTSIIEQTAGVFREFLGEDSVLEHHSALDPVVMTARDRLAAENWDAPVVVTTTVQLFESLFASRTSRLRKLHNLANSVLILDEAQALPTGVLRPVTMVLDQLVRHFRVSVVLCTATQPALRAVFRDLPEPMEIAPNPDRLFRALERVAVETPPPDASRSWENIAEEISQAPQALAIVNSRPDCRRLHRLLPEGSYHLSTWQCAEHRTQLLHEIKSRLKTRAPVRVASTSLVEAGVDIDFPTVFRAMAGLDSLAQAAGRCNREGRLDGLGRFVVFRPEETSRVAHVAQTTAAAEAALARHGPHPFRPAAFEDFFRDLYWMKGAEALDAFGVLPLLRMGDAKRDGDPLDFRFRTAAERFRMIDDSQETIIVPWPWDGTVERVLDELRVLGPSRDRLRRLQRHTVPVHRRHVQALQNSAAIEEMHGLNVLVRPDCYDDTIGLILEPDDHMTIESLIA